jgi:hypothetical protein
MNAVFKAAFFVSSCFVKAVYFSIFINSKRLFKKCANIDGLIFFNIPFFRKIFLIVPFGSYSFYRCRATAECKKVTNSTRLVR